MDEQAANLIHRAIEGLKHLDATERDAFFSRADLLKALKASKPWKARYNGCSTAAQFWASIGLKPSTVDLTIRSAYRFGPLSIMHNIPVVPSRLIKLLPIKEKDENDLIELLHKASDIVPYSAFRDTIAERKGAKAQDTCECHTTGKGVEVWHKHKCCGKWVQVS